VGDKRVHREVLQVFRVRDRWISRSAEKKKRTDNSEPDGGRMRGGGPGVTLNFSRQRNDEEHPKKRGLDRVKDMRALKTKTENGRKRGGRGNY